LLKSIAIRNDCQFFSFIYTAEMLLFYFQCTGADGYG
jgi:hypothetical protein